MKTQISSIELHFLVGELRQLIGGKVDKIYHPSKEEVLISIHLPGVGKKLLRIIAGKCLWLSESREAAGEPSNFCIFLRKQLSSARIRKIEQLEPERIAKITLESKEGRRGLIAELFGRGNILLTDEKEAILSAIDYHKFKDRTIRPKESYTYPKKEINIFSLSIEGLKAAIRKTEKDSLATFLAVDLGLGGTFSEEVCIASGIDKAAKPSEAQEKKMLDAIHALLRKKPEPNIVKKDGKMIDIAPFKMKIYAGFEIEEIPSISSGLDLAFSEISRKPSKKEQDIAKLERIIKAQEEKIAELEQAETENREKGELIFSNYQLISGIIKELREIGKRHSWHEIKERLKGHKMIKDVDVKEKRVVLEING